MLLSVIIPTLNAARSLPATLDALGQPAFGHEVIVVDARSTDGTLDLAERRGLHQVTGPRSRGVQMGAGAAIAKGPWLLFLHADTRLAAGWETDAAAFMADPENAGRAAYFTFALDDDRPAARRLERLVAWRNRAWALPYGDQGLLIAADTLDALGGVPNLPIMEDVALVRRLVRRLGRTRLIRLPARAVTSAERYRRGGYLLRPLRNLLCLGLYFAGVPPRWIERLYR